MSKISLSDLASGFRSSNKLNENFAAIRDAFDNTVSRDGSVPNAMLAPLDMNSNRVINLGAPVNPTDALRLMDVTQGSTLSPQTEVVDNVTLLRAQTWPGGRPKIVSLVYNWTLGDEGGLFYWDNTSVETDNGATVVKEAGTTTGRWKRILGGYLNPKWFGAVGDGVADDTAAINAAITTAKTIGRPTQIFLNGSFKISSTIVVDQSNISIVGAGGDYYHDVGTAGANARAKLIWAGATNGTMMQFVSPVGASNQKQNGGGVSDVFFNCANIADIGLQILSWNSGEFRNLNFLNPKVAAIDMGVVATLGEARDPQANRFSQISSRHYETTGGTGGLLRLRGDATANASLNIFEQLDCQFSNGTAYLFQNSDNNFVSRARAVRASGTGNAVVFEGSNAAANQVARGNVLTYLSANAPVVCRGTSSFTHPSFGNASLLFDVENGTPAPTIETGSNCIWSDTNGLSAFNAIVEAAVGEAVSSANAAKAAQTNESLYVVNGSENHIKIANLDGSINYGISHDAGWLRFARAAGTGGFKFTPSAAIANHADDTAAASGGVPVGGIYRTGSALKIRVT